MHIVLVLMSLDKESQTLESLENPISMQYSFTRAASVTAIGFAQRIEAVNCYDLAVSSVTEFKLIKQFIDYSDLDSILR
jgi:hypothetical protein